MGDKFVIIHWTFNAIQLRKKKKTICWWDSRVLSFQDCWIDLWLEAHEHLVPTSEVGYLYGGGSNTQYKIKCSLCTHTHTPSNLWPSTEWRCHRGRPYTPLFYFRHFWSRWTNGTIHRSIGTNVYYFCRRWSPDHLNGLAPHGSRHPRTYESALGFTSARTDDRIPRQIEARGDLPPPRERLFKF